MRPGIKSLLSLHLMSAVRDFAHPFSRAEAPQGKNENRSAAGFLHFFRDYDGQGSHVDCDRSDNGMVGLQYKAL